MLAHAVVQTVFEGRENRGRETRASPLDAMVDLRVLNPGTRNQVPVGRRRCDALEEDSRPCSRSWNRFAELVSVREVLGG